MRFLFFLLRLLYSILGNCFASTLRTSASASLTLFLGQFLFNLQRNMISIFHISNRHHSHLIYNFISQTIHVPGDLLIITFSMNFSNVYPVELLSVFLHYHPLLSKIFHSSKQIDLVISGYKFGFHVCNHSVPAFDFFLSFAMPVSLQFIPPHCCMPFKSSDEMFDFLILFDIFIIELLIHSSKEI
jgi:hypothetical protein